MKKPFTGKKEVSVAYNHKSQDKAEHRPAVEAVMISKPAPTQQRNNQSRTERPVIQFTRINMTLSQVLPHLLKSNLVTLRKLQRIPTLPLLIITQILVVLTIQKVQVMIQTTTGL